MFSASVFNSRCLLFLILQSNECNDGPVPSGHHYGFVRTHNFYVLQLVLCAGIIYN